MFVCKVSGQGGSQKLGQCVGNGWVDALFPGRFLLLLHLRSMGFCFAIAGYSRRDGVVDSMQVEQKVLDACGNWAHANLSCSVHMWNVALG